MLVSLAPAKINLVLEVIGKYEEGYHEICSLFQTISLYDVLSFRLAEEISLVCNVKELEFPDNLVLQAARLLKETSGCKKGATIHLRKNIPWSAGLGGGSSDAATTLVGLKRLWGLKLSFSELLQLGSKLGSDVAFFLYGGLALAEGRGERITPLPFQISYRVVLLVPFLPKVPQKTEKLYARLEKANFTKGQFTGEVLDVLSRGGEPDDSQWFNVFEKVAWDFFPGLWEYRKRFLEAGAPGVHLAGSGPALFTLVKEAAKAQELYTRLKNQGLECYVAETAAPEKVADN